MRKFGWLVIAVVLATAPSWSQDVNAEFNYNGRVRVQGQPFDGPGQFKFALINLTASQSYWSNDGTSVSGSEPDGFVSLECLDGFFSVAIGDTLTGMDPLTPTLFNENERIYLRVWFNDGASGFQRLRPDRRVINPALLGQRAAQDIFLYVDATNGDDANNGLTTDTAKQTIQAAWDVIPNIVDANITVRVFDGEYAGGVVMSNRVVKAGHTITVVGNRANPQNVVVYGDEPGNPGVAVETHGFNVVQQKDLVIQGFWFRDFTSSGCVAARFSNITVEDCLATGCWFGYNCTQLARFVGNNLEARDGGRVDASGVYANRGGFMYLENFRASNLNRGVFGGSVAILELSNASISDCTYACVQANNCAVIFRGVSDLSDSSRGVLVSYNALLTYLNGSVTNFINTSINEQVETGAQIERGSTSVQNDL